MYKNQYFASTKIIKDKFPNFNKIKVGKLFFYINKDLLYHYEEKNNIEILKLGYIINPFFPNDNDEKTVKYLIENCPSQDQFIKEIKNYSGRFAIIYKNSTSFIICCDAVHFRQVYYNFNSENISITSNIKMFLDYFDLSLKINELKRELINLKTFNKREHAWFGENSIDERVKKLLPNHYLDINKKEVKRLPYFYSNELKTDDDYINYTVNILKGTYKYLIRNYSLIQPLTAGLDTRMLLAASKDYKDEIYYYLFDKGIKPDVADIKIPFNLSKKLNFNFSIYAREEFNKEFLALFKQEHAYPRIIPKTANIQHHYYYSQGNKRTISVSGVVGEVVRSFYGYTKNENINPKILYEFSGYTGQSYYVFNEIEKWYLETRAYANENNLSLLDLFYWEQRLGNWGALYPFEQDIAIEENSPFNNRSLLMNLHRVDYRKRKAPKYSFFIELVRVLWKEALCEPINPDRFKIIDLLKEKSMLRYHVLRAKRTLNI